MADGTPYVLPPVHLAASGVETVDINSALAQSPPAVQLHLSRFGSASVKYHHDWQGVVLASMSILDVARSLEYMPYFWFPAKLAPEQKSVSPAQAYEGLWWRYGDGSAGFVALANTTDDPVNVEVDVSGLNAPAGTNVVLGPHRTAMLDLKDFFAGDPGRVGGLHIGYKGARGAIQVVGGLEDAVKGFSADLPVSVRFPPVDQVGPQQMAAAGVMVNQQDPLLNFPASVSFTPYAFFRNISDTARTLKIVAWYMDGRTAKSLPLPDLPLQPGQAQELPVADLLRKQPQVQDFTLSYSYDGHWGDILAGIGSTDQGGNYVFPVVPAAAYKSGPRMSHYWLASGGFDTMYTLWNPEADAQELLVTLKYGASGQSYKLPVTLEGHASTMIDIGELIRTRQLDQDGNTLPSEAGQGSLMVGGPTGELEDAINVVMGMGIYNPTKATCGSGNEYCAGMVSSAEVDLLFGVIYLGSKQQHLVYNDNLGYQNDVSMASQWTSDNGAVLTVGSAGLVTAHAGGSAHIQAHDANRIPVYAFINWQGFEPPCPTTDFGGQSTGTVTPELDSISPTQVQAGNEVTVFLYGSGFGGSQQVYIEGICETSSPCTATGTDTAISVNISTGGAFSGNHDVDIVLGDGQLLGDAQELSVLSCPTGVSVDAFRTVSVPLTASNMNSNTPAFRTGFGMLSYMALSPSSGFNWNGTKVRENPSGSNNCPAALGNMCGGNSEFTVGQNAPPVPWYPGAPSVPTNEFFDFHTTIALVDALAGQTAGYSCQANCTQTYSCGGNQIGSTAFTITIKLQHDSINGQAVTVTSVTKH